MEKDFTCEWGIEFKVGDIVVARKLVQQKWGSNEGSYVVFRILQWVKAHYSS